MKKILNRIKAVFAITVLLLSFIACDKDFTTIGVDVIGANNFELDNFSFPVVTYNNKLGPVQTNGLPANLIGFYNDPVIYGSTTANVVSQMNLAGVGILTTFGVNVQLDSVALTLPYFSHVDTSSDTNYALDSIYGNPDNGIKLSIYRNNYFLSDYDSGSNFEDSQKYYSDGSTASGEMIPTPSESDLLFNVVSLIPSAEEIELWTNFFTPQQQLDDPENNVEEVIGTLIPSFRIVQKAGVDADEINFWKELILDKAGQTEISNNNNFRDYFKGLYIKAEPVLGDGHMVLFNMASTSSNITLYYKSVNEFDDEDTDGIPDDADYDVIETITGIDTDNDGIYDEADADVGNDGDIDDGKTDINGDGIDDAVVFVNEDTVVLNFSGNRVNLLNNDPANTVIDDADGMADDENGDEKLYLKGGEGSMAIIDLFNGMVEDENGSEVSAMEHFENTFKNEEGNETRLINEAYLVFYEDEFQITNPDDHKYDRLYLYDLESNLPIIDYFFDTVEESDPYNSVINHLGQRFTDENGNNKFKIKITQHIINILSNDSENTKLGLALSTNVNSIQNADVFGTTELDDLNKVTSGIVLSPKGTVLHGNSTTTTDKKVELKIYYTEPKSE